MLLRRAVPRLGETSPALVRQLATDLDLLPDPPPAGASLRAPFGFGAAAAAAAAGGLGGYYLFRGSETAPPCDEDAVTWAVVSTPVPAEFAHMRRLRIAQARAARAARARVLAPRILLSLSPPLSLSISLSPSVPLFLSPSSLPISLSLSYVSSRALFLHLC